MPGRSVGAEQGAGRNRQMYRRLLQEIPSELWTRELVAVAERAIEENGQLQNANLLGRVYKSVPEATAELLAPARERLEMDVPVDAGVTDDDIPF